MSKTRLINTEYQNAGERCAVTMIEAAENAVDQHIKALTDHRVEDYASYLAAYERLQAARRLVQELHHIHGQFFNV